MGSRIAVRVTDKAPRRQFVVGAIYYANEADPGEV